MTRTCLAQVCQGRGQCLRCIFWLLKDVKKKTRMGGISYWIHRENYSIKKNALCGLSNELSQSTVNLQATIMIVAIIRFNKNKARKK